MCLSELLLKPIHLFEEGEWGFFLQVPWSSSLSCCELTGQQSQPAATEMMVMPPSSLSDNSKGAYKFNIVGGHLEGKVFYTSENNVKWQNLAGMPEEAIP